MIEKYSFGKIVINKILYQHDVLVFSEVVLANWWRRQSHELCFADIQAAVKEFSPTSLVVGTGKFGLMQVMPETATYLESLHIRLIAEKTQAACFTFNQLSKTERPLGAFHLTC